MTKPRELKDQQQDLEQVLEKSLRDLADIKFALDVSSIVAITDRKGTIIYVNDKFCEISKYSREELLGQTHRIINSGYHSREFFINMWKTIAGGKVWKGELRNKAKNGNYYWVDTTIVPFLDKKGKPYQYIAIRNEITERKKMEEALSALPQRIIQAQESERERISREIHDDLGQSLATLKMLIQSTLNPAAGAHKFDKSCRHVVAYLNTIIDKTRNIASALRPSTLEFLGLSTAVKTMVEEIRLNKNLNVRFYPGPIDKFYFKGGAINLFRIIQEALANVVKHSGATAVDISIKRKNDRLVVAIKDNGKGFSSGRREDARRLRGLGLSTMKERAQLLQGELSIVSKPKEGTIVTVSVPVNSSGENYERV